MCRVFSPEELSQVPHDVERYPDPERFKRRLKYVENEAREALAKGENPLASEIIRYIEMCEKLDLTDW